MPYQILQKFVHEQNASCLQREKVSEADPFRSPSPAGHHPDFGMPASRDCMGRLPDLQAARRKAEVDARERVPLQLVQSRHIP